MWRDRVRRLLDIAQVGLAVRRQRRRYADDDGVHVAHLFETRRGAQSPGGDSGADLRAWNVPEVALAGIDAGGLLRVDIKTDHPEARRPRGQCEWHADIAKPDNTDDGFFAGIQIVHCELRFARMSLERGREAPCFPHPRQVGFYPQSLSVAAPSPCARARASCIQARALAMARAHHRFGGIYRRLGGPWRRCKRLLRTPNRRRFGDIQSCALR